MVTSHKMNENEMGYRGSKSDLNTSNKSKSVKEQRVDGSWFGYNPKLRCTLVGGESRYRFRIPSKQLNVKKFSTFKYFSHVNPWFWSGLIDGEGSFSIIIDRNESRKLGWRVQSKFQMSLHKRDLSLLLQLQNKNKNKFEADRFNIYKSYSEQSKLFSGF